MMIATVVSHYYYLGGMAMMSWIAVIGVVSFGLVVGGVSAWFLLPLAYAVLCAAGKLLAELAKGSVGK